jgi:putative membrane protein
MNDYSGDHQAVAHLGQGTRLSFERTYLAHERTQVAWVRTSRALISFGFAIATFLDHLPERSPARPSLPGGRGVGILMILIGLVALVLASIQHGRALKAVRTHCPGLQPSLAWVIVTLLALLGVLALVAVFLRE